MWSKVGRFVDGLHAVSDIITKISVNCVINLHVVVLFTCLFLWVSIMHDHNCLYVYGYFPYMLHVCVYCYFSVNSCIYVNYFFVTFYIYVSARALCVYILIACSSKKIMWHSSVGCWVCYSMFHGENESLLWCIVACPGWSRMLHTLYCWPPLLPIYI